MQHPEANDPTILTDIRMMFGLGILATLFAVSWFVFYVQPREDFLLSVAECTGDDSSETAWERCSEEIRSATVR